MQPDRGAQRKNALLMETVLTRSSGEIVHFSGHNPSCLRDTAPHLEAGSVLVAQASASGGVEVQTVHRLKP